MSDLRCRLRASASTREFEIEGSEEFVEKYWPELKLLLSEAGELDVPCAVASANPPPVASQDEPDDLPGTFGDYLSKFGDLSGPQQILIAGYYYQRKVSDDNFFTTGQAHQLLKDQAIRLSNPS